MRITEIFKSIQGESSRAGLPCAFVRTTFCPLRCVWCDSKYTFQGGTERDLDSIVAEVQAMNVKRVEITGGEPMAQKETPELCRRFLDLGYEVLLETSGHLAVDAVDPRVKKIVDVKCPGSGEVSKNLAGIEKTLTPDDEIKFVIADRADFDWAIAWIRERKMEADSRFLFAPVWETCKPADLAEWLLASGLDARLNLQQHKVLWETSLAAERPKAVVLASGGMDSCVTAALAARDHDLYMLHVSYGQRTAAREKRAFDDVAAALGAKKTMVVSIDHLREIGASSLTDASRTVETFDPAHTGQGGIPSTYVPFRNGNLLSIACSWAIALDAGSIWFGAVQQDSSGYPDCRAEFVSAFEKTCNLGGASLEIRVPLISLSKTDIVKKGVEIGAPLEKTWSCYIAEEKACGTCESCGLRLRGFAGAGVKDPIPYR